MAVAGLIADKLVILLSCLTLPVSNGTAETDVPLRRSCVPSETTPFDEVLSGHSFGPATALAESPGAKTGYWDLDQGPRSYGAGMVIAICRLPAAVVSGTVFFGSCGCIEWIDPFAFFPRRNEPEENFLVTLDPENPPKHSSGDGIVSEGGAVVRKNSANARMSSL